MSVLRWISAFALLSPFVAAAAEASVFSIAGLSPEDAGRAIFVEADQRASGYQDLIVDLEMVLRDARGRESRRLLSISQLEVPDDGDRLLIVFDTPKPIRGTALLSYAHKFAPDDLWLYLPAVKRVKKIAGQNRSGPFLSSEFAYEDLALQEVEKYAYRLLERVPGGPAGEQYVVERIPLDEHSGYQRQIVYLDIRELRIQRIEYYDRHGRRMKNLEVSGYLEHEGRFWKAGRMLMSNEQTGKSTELAWRNFQFANGLAADRDFSTNALRRVR